jgi:hypothetical protein
MGADAGRALGQGMVAMAATATATKNVITLRGSTEIVTEFFGAPEPRMAAGCGVPDARLCNRHAATCRRIC